MIHDENHPSKSLWDDPAMAELKKSLHRMDNPPWWDLLSRAANRDLRRQRIWVEGTPREQRRFMAWIAVRAVVAASMPMAMSVAVEPWWPTLLIAFVGANWATGPLGRSRSYEYGYLKGTLNPILLERTEP